MSFKVPFWVMCVIVAAGIIYMTATGQFSCSGTKISASPQGCFCEECK